MGNKGFTLVELIVATAILGLISLAVAGFMAAGARTYGSLNYTLRLQYQAQLAMSQMQEYVIDCVDGIQWDGTDTLTIVNGDGAGQAVQFVFDAGTNTITLQKGGYTYTADGGTFAMTSEATLVEDVDDFTVALTHDDDGTLVQSVTLTLNLARQGKTYTGTQTLALRNRPTDLSTAP